MRMPHEVAPGWRPDDSIAFWPHYNFPMLWRGPLVVAVHDVIHTQFPPRKGTRTYQAFVLRALLRRLRRADRRGAPTHVVVLSRHVKVLLQRKWGFPAHRVWTVGAPVLPVFRPPKSEEDFESGFEEPTRALRLPRRYWLTVGLSRPHKNLSWLLEHLGRYWAAGEFPGVELVMAGTGQAAELLRMIDTDSRIRGRVKVLPALGTESLRALYWGAEALLFPSLAEGFGLPVAEAMACGTPVVASRRAPMNETAAGVAWFFDPARRADSEEPDDLLSALRVLSPGGVRPWPAPGAVAGGKRPDDAELEERLRRGIARAREYSPRAFVQRVLEVWHAAAGDKR